MKIIPYLYFEGNAKEALRFYESVFDGKIQTMQTYGESSMPCDENQKDQIMHASLSFGENFLMASDVTAQSRHEGNNVQLSVDVPEENLIETLFEKLAEGGSVTMPLQDTFWGATFGMLKDKFGIFWMLNHDKAKGS